jgi:hypothetical protein
MYQEIIPMRIVPMTALISALSVSILCSACATTYNLKSDYEGSVAALSEGRPEQAKESLPVKEKGSFIDLMEKTYLNLLAGKPEINDLFRYSKKIDNQVRYKVSRELKSFFYVETPEGYYASEHEIIWMHMLLSWGFSMKKDFSSAAVEAKIASNLLSMEWSPEGRFDDPFMRVFLGCMWAMAGEWEDARVDFRMAAKLDKNLAWAQSLSDLDKKPERISIVLGGVSVEPVWKSFDNDHTGIRGIRNISFTGSGMKSDLSIRQGTDRFHIMNRTPDSSYWYKRHFDRNNEISNLIEDTKYSQKMVATAVKGTAIVTGGAVLGVVIITGGVGIGGALMYWGAVSIANSGGDLIFLGLGIGVYGTVKGVSVISNSVDYAKTEVKKDLDDSDIYRYVRFLPEYSWVDWSTKKEQGALQYTRSKDKELLKQVTPVGNETNGVFIGFYPDRD